MRVFGIVGWKNSGKTTLMERLVIDICARGLSVSTVKHAHHDFDVDREGKDSHRHRVAGAREVMLASAQRWALMHELRGDDEPPLAELLARLAPVDLVLVEGFKLGDHAKIEAHRGETGRPLLALADPTILAVASDMPLAHLGRPVLDLDDTRAIADAVLAATGLAPAEATGGA